MTDQPKRSRWKRRFWLKLAAGLLFAVVAYGGVYALTVRPSVLSWAGAPGLDGGHVSLTPDYSLPIPRHVARAFFTPAHRIDRRLRPSRWTRTIPDPAQLNWGPWNK